MFKSRKFHQWYTLIKFLNIFTSQFSTNHNYIQQDSVLLSISEQYTIPTKIIFLIILPYTNTRSYPNEKIDISTGDTTIPDPP